MNFKSKLLLLTAVLVVARAFASEEDADHRSTKKCLKVRNLTVCNDAAIGGDLTVVGAICAGSIALCPAPAAGTPGIAGIGGVLAYGEVGNEAAPLTAAVVVAVGETVPFTYAGPVAGGITAVAVDGSGDGLLLANAGTYAFEYQADITAAIGASIALTTDGSTALDHSTVNAVAAAGQLNGFLVANVAAGSLVQILNNSVISASLTLTATGVGAKLIATRIA